MSNAVVISSWDPAQLVAVAAEQTAILAIGDLPSITRYKGDRERRFAHTGMAGQRSTRLLQAFELADKGFYGGGSVRQLAAGGLERGTSRNTFTCVRDTVGIVRRPLAAARASGSQTV